MVIADPSITTHAASARPRSPDSHSNLSLKTISQILSDGKKDHCSHGHELNRMHLIFAIHGYMRLGANSEGKVLIIDVTFLQINLQASTSLAV